MYLIIVARKSFSTRTLFSCRHNFRVEAVMLRARFDEHKDETDLTKAKKLLEDGEKELLANLHLQPFRCLSSF